MSGITKLHCDNCVFWVRNRERKPVLQDADGNEFNVTEPIGPAYHSYVVGYRYEKYCATCQDLVWLFIPAEDEGGVMECPNCSTHSIVHVESVCPWCSSGTLHIQREVMF